jgi:hypothetical protein
LSSFSSVSNLLFRQKFQYHQMIHQANRVLCTIHCITGQEIHHSIPTTNYDTIVHSRPRDSSTQNFWTQTWQQHILTSKEDGTITESFAPPILVFKLKQPSNQLS